ncbi:MAG: pyruvate kinase [Bacteroidota bacterium]|nr:pyruvate kinase [Bacteroidota bacterium]
MNLDKKVLKDLLYDIKQLIEQCLENEVKQKELLNSLHKKNEKTLVNFVHYLALRKKDIRKLQFQLSNLGLSSLGRAESHVMYNLKAVENILKSLQGIEIKDNGKADILHLEDAKDLLIKHTDALFQKSKRERRVRIMVTIPSEAADNQHLVHALFESGMDVARINCAHDSQADWKKMIQNIKTAQIKYNKKCPVFMDLSGPKLRTEWYNMPHMEKKYIVHPGDEIQLISSDYKGIFKSKIVLGCTLKDLFEKIQPGESVKIDDGKIEATVIESKNNSLIIKVLHTGPEGAKLKKDKSINLPETKLGIYGLTDRDKKDLEFVVKYADGVNMSFVNRKEDVKQLLKHLKELNKPNFPFTLKIETKEGFEKLPLIILEAMKSYPFGVFIARGDLAVECGWERMAEIQEEILWMCEAACVPIIWGTQVLENMVKTGIPSRAEITDAAMSQRAECVMLNKGPFVMEGIKMLDTILASMQEHQQKKVSTLRRLNLADIA